MKNKERDTFDIMAEKILSVRTEMSKDKFQEYLADKLRNAHNTGRENLRSSFRELFDLVSNNDIKDFVRDDSYYND